MHFKTLHGWARSPPWSSQRQSHCNKDTVGNTRILSIPFEAASPSLSQYNRT